MPHPDSHPGAGTDPEGRFDHWLDGFVTGTLGTEPLRSDLASGRLAQAQSGARRLHDLAAQTVMASGTAGAQQRIKETLMHNGALAAPESGASWIPSRHDDRKVAWWSLNSPFVAGALVIALIVALASTLFWTQRPDPGPSPTDAPGFAVASPDNDPLVISAQDLATPEAAPETTTAPTDVFIVSGGEVPTGIGAGTAFGTLDDDGLTLPTASGEPVTIPDVAQIDDLLTVVPGQTIITRSDHSRAMVDLATGEILFDLPAWMKFASGYYSYLFTPVDDTYTDWTMIDLATGDTRLLSDIVDLPGDTSVALNGEGGGIRGVSRFRVLEAEFTDLGFSPTGAQFGAFVIAGSLNRAAPLHDFPSNTAQIGSPALVASEDGSVVAYETRSGDDRIILLDTATGDELARFGSDTVGDDPSLVGFTEDDQLIVGTSDSIVSLDQNAGTPATVIAEGFGAVDDSLVYAPAEMVYIRQTNTILQLDLTTGETREIATGWVPVLFDFTTPDSNWITFLTRNGQVLVDARTGEIVARMQAPGNRASYPDEFGITQEWVNGDGDTVIFAFEPYVTPGTVWLLSPEFPEGLEITGPDDVEVGPYSLITLSADGSTLYAFASDTRSGPSGLWMAPLAADPDWQLVAEDITLEGIFSLNDQSRTSDASVAETKALPAQDFATPAATAFIPDLRTAHDVAINLRAGPGTDNGIIDVLPSGTLLMSVETDQDSSTTPTQTVDPDQQWRHEWRNVQTESGLTGWVREIDLEPNPDADQGQDVVTPEAGSFDALFPANTVPIFSSGPVDELSPDRGGWVDEDGLTIPLRNGETITLSDAVRVSQLLHTDIAIVEHVDGSRVSLDLGTGETLAELYPATDNEQVIGTYQFTPANEDLTDWRILDLRSGDQTTTAEISGGLFSRDVGVIPIPWDLDTPDHALAQFVISLSAGDFSPWRDLSTDEGPLSGTLVIPGNLADARFLNGSAGTTDPLRPAAALLPGEEPLVAYVTTNDAELIRLEHAVSGELIASWSDQMVAARGGNSFIAGFSPDGASLTAWSADSPLGADAIASLSWPDGEPQAYVSELGDERISMVFPHGETMLVMVTEQVGMDAGPASWKHLDLGTGEWTDLSHLDGYRWDRGYPESPWMILMSGGEPSDSSTVIIDRATGEIAARLDDPDLGMATARSPSHDFSVFAITGNTGEPETTGYVLDATSGESWPITPPEEDGTVPGGIFYSVSPDGSLLIATSRDVQGTGGEVQTWVSPVEPDAEWTSIGPRSIDTWLYFPPEP